MTAIADTMLAPLIKRKFFFNEEDALQELLRGYILNQIAKLQQEVEKFEEKYGMRFKQFEAYLHERSALLSGNSMSAMQRQRLGQAVMQEEDDWLDWKAAQEMLESWLGLQAEVLV
ncbi:MAG: hypothetical protein GWP17_05245 [Aquificales bacterium]|nr:hypothetical protein [Aquificales bacterium]